MIISDDILLMKAVLLYIIKNSKPDKRDVYSIVKTAYYEQQIHMTEWFCPTYNDIIMALDYGPVPSLMYNILRYARGEKNVLSKCPVRLRKDIASAAAAIGWKNESYSAVEDPDMDYLSVSDVDSLDKAIAKVDGMSFDEIKRDTHGEEWSRAYNSPDSNVMDYLNIAREGGADEEIIDDMAELLAVDRRYSWK